MVPPVIDRSIGRPLLAEASVRRRWDEVHGALPDGTDEQRAEYLGVSIRTFRRWRERFGL